MEKSESIKQLTAALLAAQAELKVVEKGAENPFYKSKYADLPAIFAEYQRVFPKHGLVVSQIVEGAGLRTILAHVSGEWVSGLASLMMVKSDPQGQGSAITYMRRYALASICGIVAAEDDDDGNAGSHAPKSETKPTPKSETSPNNATRVVGKIIAAYPPKGKGPHSFKVEGFPEYLKTFDEEKAAQMNDYKEAGTSVDVSIEWMSSGAYRNAMIVSVGPESVPF